MTIHNVDDRPIRKVEDWKCRNAILIIVDSLGYDLYRWLEPDLKHIPALARCGLLIKAEAVSTHTSPSIAPPSSAAYCLSITESSIKRASENRT